MLIEKSNLLLPPEPGPTHAFDLVNAQFPQRPTGLDFAERALPYLGAGVSYLANRGQSPLLQEAGTTTWNAIKRRITLVSYSTDIRRTAIEMGFPEDQAMQYSNSEPRILTAIVPKDRLSLEMQHILIPPELISLAKHEPINAMGRITRICSWVKDFIHGRHLVDPHFIKDRAAATTAHFLIGALEEDKDLELDDAMKEILEICPDGLNSLPLEARYKVNRSLDFTPPSFN